MLAGVLISQTGHCSHDPKIREMFGDAPISLNFNELKLRDIFGLPALLSKLGDRSID
jgi:hypothetical protein